MPFSAPSAPGEPLSDQSVDLANAMQLDRPIHVLDGPVERALLDWSSQSVLRISRGHVERLVNAGFVSMDGATAPADDFLSLLAPEDRDMVITLALETAAVPGARAQCSVVVAQDSAGRRPLDLRFVNAAADPRVGGLLLFVQDGSTTASSASELVVQRQISTFAAAFAAIKTSEITTNIAEQLRELLRQFDASCGSISLINSDGTIIENTVFESIHQTGLVDAGSESAIALHDLIPNLLSWARKGEPVTISTRSLPALARRSTADSPRDFLVLPRRWPNGRIGILTMCGPEGFARRELLPVALSFSDLLGSAHARQDSAAALHESEHRHRALIANSPDHLVLLDDELRIMYVSPSVSSFFGCESEELVGRRYLDFVHVEDQSELAALGQSFQYAVRVRAGALSNTPIAETDVWRWIEGTIQDLRSDPSVRAILMNGRDVTDVQHARKALAQQQRATELIATVSRRFARGRTGDTELLLQETAGELIDFIGASVAVVWLADASGATLVPSVIYPDVEVGTVRPIPMRELLAAAQTLRAGEVIFERRSGRSATPVADLVEEPDLPPIEDFVVLPVLSQNRLIGMVTMSGWSALYMPESSLVALRAVSEVLASSFAKLEIEQTLRQRATTDDLTGLLNRSAMRDVLTTMLADGVVNGKTVSVALLDLDEFKIINDTLGHERGDDMLRAVGRRLRQSLRSDDVLARLGGDEFVVAMTHQGAASYSELQDRLRDVFRAPFEFGTRNIYITASIGISQTSIDDPEATAEEMLRRADIAMYRAKHRGPGELAIFEEHMDEHVLEVLALVDELRIGIEQDQMELWLQPIVQGEPGKDISLTGVEALVRWRHPTRGLVYPGDFIAIAEQYGLISDLGSTVLSKAEVTLRMLIESGELPASAFISVNVSTMQLEQADFVDNVAKITAQSGLEPCQVHIELTESMLAQQSHWSQLAKLRSLGFNLSIDDFGTGYSSLSYAREMPADTLKVDRSFVAGVATDRRDEALAAAVISMGNALGMSVIAEGVENAEQYAALASLGCTQYQGFYFARPMPLEEFRRWMSELNGVASISV